MAVNQRFETVAPEGLDLQERVVHINRVAKVVKGGRRFSFTALVVVGDEQSVVGIGYGKAREVPIAIQKGVEQAKKNLFRVPKYKSTITHDSHGRFGSGHVYLKPASPGTGVIAGGGVRAVLELGGVHDILAKSLGSQNPINLVKATADALQSLRRPDEVATMRGLAVHEVLGLEKPEPKTEEVTGAAVADGAADDSVAESTLSSNEDLGASDSGIDTGTAEDTAVAATPVPSETAAETPVDKAAAIETDSGEATLADAPVAAVAVDAPADEASAAEVAATEEAPAEDAPVDETPAKATSVEQGAPAEAAKPADETPSDGAVAEAAAPTEPPAAEEEAGS